MQHACGGRSVRVRVRVRVRVSVGLTLVAGDRMWIGEVRGVGQGVGTVPPYTPPTLPYYTYIS